MSMNFYRISLLVQMTKRYRVWGLIMATIFSCFLSGCALPSLADRSTSTALSKEEGLQTSLGKTLSPIANQYPEQSGILMLSDAVDAFAARVMLARVAEKTLDIQYYIWRNDITGTLLLQAIHQAADRGVRVRLLVDDNGVDGMDDLFSILDTHPNIEVRLYNPFMIRRPKVLGYFTDFRRLNRRMHNKSMTVDNQLVILGGRNIGDEYFGAKDGVLFADLDVLAAGDVVDAISKDFDVYWQSQSAYPIASILGKKSEADMQYIIEKALSAERNPKAQQYIEAIKSSNFVQNLNAGKTAFNWSKVEIVSDDPKKTLERAKKKDLISAQLQRALGEPQRSLVMVSPYFVPTVAGTNMFTALAEKGVDISILTNALEATDVSAVHAGYAKRREALIKAGIKLYEMRAQPGTTGPRGVSKILGRRGVFGSAGASLHAKTFTVDDARLFIGSFNFDPRSIHLNTELGVVIHNPELAKMLTNTFIERIADNAYEVKINDAGKLIWIEHRDAEKVIHETEPGVGMLKRTWVNFIQLLPIDWLL
jgi:putative cardiolipin synthase